MVDDLPPAPRWLDVLLCCIVFGLLFWGFYMSYTTYWLGE